jgi:hypothetical protein
LKFSDTNDYLNYSAEKKGSLYTYHHTFLGETIIITTTARTATITATTTTTIRTATTTRTITTTSTQVTSSM